MLLLLSVMLLLRTFRFNDQWRFVTQRSCFLAAFIVYLESEQLISREDCSALLGGFTKLNLACSRL